MSKKAVKNQDTLEQRCEHIIRKVLGDTYADTFPEGYSFEALSAHRKAVLIYNITVSNKEGFSLEMLECILGMLYGNDNIGSREYKEVLVSSSDNSYQIYTIKEFDSAVKSGLIHNGAGEGFWVRNGFASEEEVFGSDKLDATHVVWYNK